MNDFPKDARTAPSRLDLMARLTRGFGWRRVIFVRRAAAGLLVVAAVALALRAPPGSAPVLVTVRDLAPGSTIRAADVEVRLWPPALVPSRALTSMDQAVGRVLAGAACGGEPLTEPRLAGAELARQVNGRSDAASVPIRLADGEVAALLTPGRLVDVVAAGGRPEQPTLLAAAAIVLTVLPAEAKPSTGRGRLVLVAVPRAAATKLAAATLGQEVTVTLR